MGEVEGSEIVVKVFVNKLVVDTKVMRVSRTLWFRPQSCKI